jgi:hypothetical protein
MVSPSYSRPSFTVAGFNTEAEITFDKAVIILASIANR